MTYPTLEELQAKLAPPTTDVDIKDDEGNILVTVLIRALPRGARKEWQKIVNAGGDGTELIIAKSLVKPEVQASEVKSLDEFFEKFTYQLMDAIRSFNSWGGEMSDDGVLELSRRR